MVHGQAPVLAPAEGSTGVTILAVGGPHTLGQEEWRPGSSYPAQLGVELERLGLSVSVINAGQDNPSPADSRARLADALASHASDLVIWELGRTAAAYYEGLGPVEDELVAAIEDSRANGAAVLLLDLGFAPDDMPHDRPPGYATTVRAVAERYDAALLRLVIRRDLAPEHGFALEDEDACIARLLARAIVAGKG